VRELRATGVLPYALAPVLMLGPLVANWFDRDLPFQRYSPYSLGERCVRFWKCLGLVEVRNYMVVSLRLPGARILSCPAHVRWQVEGGHPARTWSSINRQVLTSPRDP